MAKSARSSVNKRNNQRLKKRVFGPVEKARALRLNKKLEELIQTAKPSDAAKMDVEIVAAGDEDAMEDTQDSALTVSNTASKKARQAKKIRIEKKKVRKERNTIAFKPHRMKGKDSKKH